MPHSFPSIRSFVRRDSRMTRAQKEALEQNWQDFELLECTRSSEIHHSFQRRAPLTLEIGSGNGACVLALAEQKPEENFFAVDVHRPGLGRLLNRAVVTGLCNIRVSDKDICELLAGVVEPVFDRVLVFFPDPWPKRRHQKRRLLQHPFFDLLEQSLHRHGRVFIATDDANYAESIIKTVAGLPRWVNLAGPARWAPRPCFRPITKFEAKALAAGSTVYDFVFARC